MFEKWKEKMIVKKGVKLSKLPVFHQPIDTLHFQLGTYRSGKMRPFDILVDNHTKKTITLINAVMTLTAQLDLVISGIIKDENQPLTHVFSKDEIKWKDFDHFHCIGLNEQLDLCHNPNGGTLDISLHNGDSILIHYTFDEQKNKQLVVS